MPPNPDAPFLAIATHPSVMRRAGKIAGIVGLVLAVINHGDKMLTGQVDGTALIQILLTFAVPYCVSTVSSVWAVRERG